MKVPRRKRDRTEGSRSIEGGPLVDDDVVIDPQFDPLARSQLLCEKGVCARLCWLDIAAPRHTESAPVQRLRLRSRPEREIARVFAGEVEGAVLSQIERC
eukprot:823212-Rhodomonas_salina.1